MKVITLLLVVLQFMPLVIGSGYSNKDSLHEQYYSDEGQDNKYDKLDRFTFVGSGPCRISGQKVGDYVRLLTAGTLNECA